jgi:phosphatidylglycerol---prolipoprotein diacylglyceryl transferase
MPGFKIGPFALTYYGIIIMVGFVCAAYLASREARRRGQNPDLVWDGMIWVLIGGVIGARLWHILFPSQIDVARGLTTMFYLTHPLDAINTTKGGLGIPGAVLGGGLALYFFCRRAKVLFSDWADFAAPGVALAQAIGRWGNFINQELYGPPTDLPWGIFIDPERRLPGFTEYERFHPLFLYESLWNLLNMVLLLWLGRRFTDRLKSGDLFIIYLIVYPVGRFFLDFIRLDVAEVAGINANQAIMLVVAVCAAGLLFWRHRKVSEPTEND